MGEREGNRRYDYETKLAAVRDHRGARDDEGRSHGEVQDRRPPRWNAGAASTGPAARTRCVRNPRAGPRARNPNRSRLPRANSSSRRRTRISRRGSRTWKKSAPCWREDRQPGEVGDRLDAGGARTSAPAPLESRPDWRKARTTISCRVRRRSPGRTSSRWSLSIRAHAQRVRPPAGAHVPGLRVRRAREP